MGAVIGSAVYNVTLGYAAVALLARPQNSILSPAPLMRDATIYAFVLCVLLAFRYHGSITAYHGIVLLALYFVFLAFLWTTRR